MENYSVLMSVYNKEKPENLQLAMESMWNQTVPTDDFVLVCDGPLNPELDRVINEQKKEHDSLKIIRLDVNGGLGHALNVGLLHCKNELVARADSDDISIRDRCERQLVAFNLLKDISICSGTVIEFNNNTNNIVGRRILPENHEQIIAFSKKRNPFNHPAIMFKKTAVIFAGNYNEDYHLFEDYHLWIRMLKNGAKAYNISNPLLYMRVPDDLYKRRGGREYAKTLLQFGKWKKEIGWISLSDYLTGTIPHVIVCLLPNTMRKRIYSILHS